MIPRVAGPAARTARELTSARLRSKSKITIGNLAQPYSRERKDRLWKLALAISFAVA